MNPYRETERRTWPDHRGNKVPDAVYHLPPDPQVGNVLTAWSNWTEAGPRPATEAQRFRMFFGFLVLVGTFTALLGGATWWAVIQLEWGLPDWVPFGAWAVALMVAVGYLGLPRPWCNYIGDEGFAQHRQTGFGPRDHVMRFSEAASLALDETARYSNGVYQGTSYTFTFRDARGETCMKFEGQRFTQGVGSKQANPEWDFYAAVQARWNAVRWERAVREKADRGEVTFGTTGTTYTVRDGGLVVTPPRGQPLAFEASEIESVRLHDGVLEIRRVGAKEGLFVSKGIERAGAGRVEDLPVLLRAVEAWVRKGLVQA